MPLLYGACNTAETTNAVELTENATSRITVM